MATTLNAGTPTSGAVISADTSGILQLQSGSTPTTAVTINASQAVGFGTSPSYGTSGQVLTSQGSGTAPTWTTSAAGTSWPEVWTPTNTSPANGATGISSSVSLTGSGYYDLYNFGQSASQWEISTVSSFGTTVYSSGDAAAGTSKGVVSTSYLTANTTYYWRTRYKDNNGVYSAWSTPTTFTTGSNISFTVDYLVIGGGAAGNAGSTGSGGGSAGSYKSGSVGMPGGSTTITIGAGGNAGTSPTSGSASQLGALVNAPGGTVGGNSGDNIARGSDNTWAGGGGAGAGGAGSSGASQGSAGNGGPGLTWVDGVTRAGGGGGGLYTGAGARGSIGSGGSGGGGAGNSTPGTANTGSGGGGATSGNAYSTVSGGAGGSGVVIIRYPGTAAVATGGTISITGGYVYHTFTTSGVFAI